MMNLSYWERTSFFKNYDYTIIGAGIVGLFTAIEIKSRKPNAKVLVLERSAIPDGASTKNAGFACFGSLSEIIEHRNRTSEKTFLELVDKRNKGIQKLKNFLGPENIDFISSGAYEVFKNDEKEIYQSCIEKMQEYNRLLEDIIGINVYEIADDAIEKFGLKNVEHLIYSKYEAQIHSGKMMQSLIQWAFSLGVNILFNADVLAYIKHDAEIILKTNLSEITTSAIIVCNNAFAKKLIPSIDLQPGRGQVLITNKIHDLKLKGNFHYDKGYYYFRNIDNRVLIGGGRNLDFKGEETFDFGTSEIIQNSLKEILRDVILSYTDFEIEQTWSGIMAFGKELNPIVAEIEKNVFCAVRCNGMGVAIGPIIAEEVAELAIKN